MSSAADNNDNFNKINENNKQDKHDFENKDEKTYDDIELRKKIEGMFNYSFFRVD